MPTTCPARFTRGPPELPGLIAASVWIAGYAVSVPPALDPSLTVTGRLSELTMPSVTVEARPNGEPTATTSWPTARSLELPILAGVRPETPWALMTARSVTGSVPTIVALAVLPSLKLTDILPPLAATAATWLLVRISPLLLKMMPEPEPEPCWPSTLIFTTDGKTALATPSTEPFDAAALPEPPVFDVLEVCNGSEAVLDEPSPLAAS